MTTKTTSKPFKRPVAVKPSASSDEAVEIDFDDTKPLSPLMAAKWARAKRGRGRPRIGEGSERVLISMEKRLLLVTDALARRKGLDRSKLVALAIREMLERDANANAPGNAAVSKLM